ncbi:MAG: lycopene cyclase domain-containing protein [Patescibacteria group bacterium]|jgi:lycopene cyclase domain-containing protein
MEYLFILVGLLILTIALHRVFRLKLYANTNQAIITILVFLVVGVVWDSLAIARGHWLFPPEHNTGWIIGKMPVEEYLFMLIQPYFVMIIYSIIKARFIKANKNGNS